MRPWAMTLTTVMVVSMCGTPVQADPPRATTCVVGDVRLRGLAQTSSTGVSLEPAYQFTNLAAQPRTVELVALVSPGHGEHRALPLQGPRRYTLAPRASRTVVVAHGGHPINAGTGLSYYRFALSIAVDGHRGTAVASNAYVCRIPVRLNGPGAP